MSSALKDRVLEFTEDARKRLKPVKPFDQLEVRNPYNNHLIGTVPCTPLAKVERAIARAHGYDNHLDAWQRYLVLQNFSEHLMARKQEFAQLISQESGKTIRDAMIEVNRAYQAFLLSAEEAKRLNGEVIPLDAVAGSTPGTAIATREPLGVIAAITPFNFPLNLVAHKVAPALAANNAVVLKPSESTPLTALKMRELLIASGMPANMLQIVTGNPVPIVDLFCSDDRISKISFTGSAEVGKMICHKTGMKPVSMELGGNDPLVVLADADLDAALACAIEGAYGNSGQRCTSIKRIIVEDAIADQFIERFVAGTQKLVVGDPIDPRTDIGPLINKNAAIGVEQKIRAAINSGATLLTGGQREGAIVWPTVLDNVTMNNPVVADETFGPVAPFIRVADFEEAIAVANNTQYGLQAGVFTNDLGKAKRAMKNIQAGAVMINRGPGFRAEHLPFGGIKDSGMGREGIRYAVESMTRLKTVVF